MQLTYETPTILAKTIDEALKMSMQQTKIRRKVKILYHGKSSKRSLLTYKFIENCIQCRLGTMPGNF